jgi:hypothetical protein
MRQPTVDTLPRPRDLSDRSDPAVLYVRSYLLIRTAVGLIGILLPLVLIAGESWVRGGGVHVGSSLSSYYYTSMQDVFVGALCIIAVLLATYLSGRPWTWDFWLSLLAGLALLGVVFFPIGRPGLPAGALRCGSTPAPPSCSPMEQLLGEVRTEQVHLITAAGCFLLLAALSFLFARQERARGGSLAAACLHGLCGVVVLLAIAAAGFGNFVEVDLGPLPLLFAGETAAVWAFAVSWLLAGRDLWLRLLRPRRGTARAIPRPREAQHRPLPDGPPVAAQPDPGSTPDTNWGAARQPCDANADPSSHERYPWSDGGSWPAVPRVISNLSVGSKPAPSRDLGVPQPRGWSARSDDLWEPVSAHRDDLREPVSAHRDDLWEPVSAHRDDLRETVSAYRDDLRETVSAHYDDLRETVSANHVIDEFGVRLLARCGRCDDPVGAPSSAEQHVREPADERAGMVEVARLAKRLAASCPDGDRILPRLERWADIVGPGTDSASSRRSDDVREQPMWYVGQHMWLWRISTPWDQRGRSISANLMTFIDANGVPFAPTRPGAEFRGSYPPLAEALRQRMAERSARVSICPSPVVQERALERHAAAGHALVADEDGAFDPHIPACVEQVLALRLDLLRLTAELDQTREALQRLVYVYDGTITNRDDRP